MASGNTDDLDELDTLCLKAGALGRQQDSKAAMVLREEMIRDLTIGLGDILLRYLRGEWIIQGLQTAEGEPACESWVLMLHSDAGQFS